MNENTTNGIQILNIFFFKERIFTYMKLWKMENFICTYARSQNRHRIDIELSLDILMWLKFTLKLLMMMMPGTKFLFTFYFRFVECEFIFRCFFGSSMKVNYILEWKPHVNDMWLKYRRKTSFCELISNRKNEAVSHTIYFFVQQILKQIDKI